MHHAHNTWSDICFPVNLLARFDFLPDKRTLKCVMYILEYLWRTIDMDSFYSEEFKLELIGCADAKYFSDPHKTWSQTHNLFACGGTIIFWWSMKQMLLCRNKSPHKASPECVWLRSMTRHIQEICDFSSQKNLSTTMYG